MNQSKFVKNLKYLLLCKMVVMGNSQQSFRPGNEASQEHIV